MKSTCFPKIYHAAIVGLGIYLAYLVYNPPCGRMFERALFLLFFLVVWHQILFSPCKVVLNPDHTLSFKSIVREAIVAAGDIVEIETGSKLVVFRHRNGKIVLSRAMSRLDEFVEEVRAINPSVSVHPDRLGRFFQGDDGALWVVIAVFLVIFVTGTVVLLMAL